MNLNIIGYFIFITIIVLIIVFVGKICYRNGNIFVAELIPDHLDVCQQINKTLLVAYYLVNIGYCAMTLVGWEEVKNPLQLVEVLSIKIATIICILSILHYLNILLLTTNINKLIK
ncbi:hypothetical protein [Pedobacter jejuensis]|uniref:Integral membrane protein n=1 Tax=Pedobacter jejuensis TaxID=1268550 RepID=A0A3N0BSP8_9SPHI|nr:hypothetical protein [Pedobacter jejuensis]RNL51859.1 hypothetical protein D7004_13770 [Pedobacter jejuensis]